MPSSSRANGPSAAPEFSDYPISVYNGARHIPSYYTLDSSGVWQDDIVHPNSTMLLAGYQIDGSADHPSECRDRVFVLSHDGNEAKPVTPTAAGCE